MRTHTIAGKQRVSPYAARAVELLFTLDKLSSVPRFVKGGFLTIYRLGVKRRSGRPGGQLCD